MRTCSVFYCKNKVKFEFPSDENLKKKWLKDIRKPNFEPKKGQGLCICHFKKYDFRTTNNSYGMCYNCKIFC